MQMPLEDVKVLDLSHALAGPFCSTMLADFGAEVIKLEPKDTGDIAGAWGPALPGGETSYFVNPSGSPRRPARSAPRLRCWASTPTRCWVSSWVSAPSRSPPFARRESSARIAEARREVSP